MIKGGLLLTMGDMGDTMGTVWLATQTCGKSFHMNHDQGWKIHRPLTGDLMFGGFHGTSANNFGSLLWLIWLVINSSWWL